MASHYEAPIRRPLVTGEKSYHDVTVDVAKPVEGRANKQWWIVFSISLVAFLWGIGCILYTISTGIGTWGLNKTVGWAPLIRPHCAFGKWAIGSSLTFRSGTSRNRTCASCPI